MRSSSLSRAFQPGGTSPDGLAETSRPSPDASTPWKATNVRRSLSRARAASASSQLGRKPTTSASTGWGVGAGVGAGIGVTSSGGDGDGLTGSAAALDAAEGSGDWPVPDLSVTVMQAEATSGRLSSSSQAAAVTRLGRAGRRSGRWRIVTTAPYQGSAFHGATANAMSRLRDAQPGRADGSAAGRLLARGGPRGGSRRRSRSELRTTLTELKAIAAAASTGSRRMPKNG